MSMWIIYHWIYSMVMEFLALYHEYITKLIFFLNCYSIMRMYLSSHIVHVYLHIPLYIHHISIISHKISHTATIQITWDGIFHLSHQHHQEFLTISHDFPLFPILSHVFLWYIPIIGWYTPLISIDPIVMQAAQVADVAQLRTASGILEQRLSGLANKSMSGIATMWPLVFPIMTQLWLINTNDVCWTLLVYN